MAQFPGCFKFLECLLESMLFEIEVAESLPVETVFRRYFDTLQTECYGDFRIFTVKVEHAPQSGEGSCIIRIQFHR